MADVSEIWSEGATRMAGTASSWIMSMPTGTATLATVSASHNAAETMTGSWAAPSREATAVTAVRLHAAQKELAIWFPAMFILLIVLLIITLLWILPQAIRMHMYVRRVNRLPERDDAQSDDAASVATGKASFESFNKEKRPPSYDGKSKSRWGALGLGALASLPGAKAVTPPPSSWIVVFTSTAAASAPAKTFHPPADIQQLTDTSRELLKWRGVCAALIAILCVAWFYIIYASVIAARSRARTHLGHFLFRGKRFGMPATGA